MYYDAVLEYDSGSQGAGGHVLMCVHVLSLDIPDDEAQYWTGKLEQINTMGIHDEVKDAGVFLLRTLNGFFYFWRQRSVFLQYTLQDDVQNRPLPLAASQCCEFTLPYTSWPLDGSTLQTLGMNSSFCLDPLLLTVVIVEFSESKISRINKESLGRYSSSGC